MLTGHGRSFQNFRMGFGEFFDFIQQHEVAALFNDVSCPSGEHELIVVYFAQITGAEKTIRITRRIDASVAPEIAEHEKWRIDSNFQCARLITTVLQSGRRYQSQRNVGKYGTD